MTTRVCRYCSEEKPLNSSFFGHNKDGGFRWKCRTCMNEYSRQYRLKNLDKADDRSFARRLLEGKKWNMYDRYAIWFFSNKRCSYCHKEIIFSYMHLDHILPLSKGGKDSMDNLACSCEQCNKSKREKTLEQFEIYRKSIGEASNFANLNEIASKAAATTLLDRQLLYFRNQFKPI